MLATLGEERVLRLYRTPDNGLRWGLMASVDVGRGAGVPAEVAFAPGGMFCIACGDIVAKVAADWAWEVYASVVEHGEGNAVVCADWASSGYIAVGREDGCVEVWRLGEDGLVRVGRMLAEGAGAVVRMEWDRAGGVLASVHADRSVRTWSRMPGAERGSWVWGVRDRFALEGAGGEGL